ncbi:hypothetical protein [Micromonospora sp. ATCC 39149]|uniref:SMI1/KNR4 family protein n=1 Tax=Micromonospora carbonacea TaxID=47853 RepID=A0A7D6CC25_9ACTN|nr:hypothetical protein [Micromonospora sp. ATCC 39149]QLJ96843.1 hypothetical protein HZU44_18280 [Micromonospora carbonacea]
MKSEESPFPSSWWGIGLASAGVDTRPDVGTYGRYTFSDLPALPFELNGSYDWLRRQVQHDEWAINADGEGDLSALLTACAAAGLPLPADFVTFLQSPELPGRVRSSTACFLDLAGAPMPSPTGKGWLIRFLADQQGCLYWYLYLTEDGADHAVLSTMEFYDPQDRGPSDPETEAPNDIRFCAESFEAFICRYWLENEIFFADVDGTPLPEGAAEYLERYRK